MHKDLPAVYRGEYTQQNSRLHSLQVTLFTYKQVPDQGVRLGAGVHCATREGWYFQERPAMNTTHLKEVLGTRWYEGQTTLLAKDETLLLPIDLGNWEVSANGRIRPFDKWVAQRSLASDRPHELPALSAPVNLGETLPFHETSVQTQSFIRTMNILQ